MRLETRKPVIPLVLKLLFTAFLAWHLSQNLPFYGPMNYLWFCDIALLTTAIGLWLNNRLLLSMTAVSLFGPSAFWSADFLHKILIHTDLTGMTDYMEDPHLPLSLRMTSTFHLWVPILLMYLFWRIGYDRRAIWWQTGFAVVVLILSRVLGDPPPAHDLHQVVNINCAYGTSDQGPQTKLPAALYLCKVIAKCWIEMYLPTHLLLWYLFGRKPRSADAGNTELARQTVPLSPVR